jgi:transposase InsO family protein
MAGRLGVARSTIYSVLRRHGLSRLSTLDRTTGIPIRYVKDHPGELVHVDIKQLGRVPDGGGWRVNGIEHRGTKQGVGYEYLHSMVDDHTRVAYTEALDTQDAQACAGFMLRAAERLASLGYRIDAVMTDNAKAYTSHAFQTALHTIGATHLRTRPFRPQTNGKVERFHRTLADKWAYRQSYTTNNQRRAALNEFLNFYNQQRPHSALNGAPPMTVLVNHHCGNDT